MQGNSGVVGGNRVNGAVPDGARHIHGHAHQRFGVQFGHPFPGHGRGVGFVHEPDDVTADAHFAVAQLDADGRVLRRGAIVLRHVQEHGGHVLAAQELHLAADARHADFLLHGPQQTVHVGKFARTRQFRAERMGKRRAVVDTVTFRASARKLHRPCQFARGQHARAHAFGGRVDGLPYLVHLPRAPCLKRCLVAQENAQVVQLRSRHGHLNLDGQGREELRFDGFIVQRHGHAVTTHHGNGLHHGFQVRNAQHGQGMRRALFEKAVHDGAFQGRQRLERLRHRLRGKNAFQIRKHKYFLLLDVFRLGRVNAVLHKLRCLNVGQRLSVTRFENAVLHAAMHHAQRGAFPVLARRVAGRIHHSHGKHRGRIRGKQRLPGRAHNLGHGAFAFARGFRHVHPLHDRAHGNDGGLRACRKRQVMQNSGVVAGRRPFPGKRVFAEIAFICHDVLLQFRRQFGGIDVVLLAARMSGRRGKLRAAFIGGPGFQVAEIALFKGKALRPAVRGRKVHRAALSRQLCRKVQHARFFSGLHLPGLHQFGHPRFPAFAFHLSPVRGKVRAGLFRLLLRLGFGGLRLVLFLLVGVGFLFQVRVFSAQSLKLALQLPDLPLQFFYCHGVSFAARGGIFAVAIRSFLRRNGCRKIHRYGVAAVLELHRRQPVYGGLRRAQKRYMTQTHTVRHEAHAHMAVVPLRHQVPHLVRNAGEAGIQFPAFTSEPVHPAEGRSPVALRMPETERRVPFLRVVAPGYGVQVSRRKRLGPPGAVRERARAGYLDPFLVHEKSPCFRHHDRKTGALPGKGANYANYFQAILRK
nr:MAG TPA_asm: hypothetical protein [Caudoviricetes sp.]